VINTPVKHHPVFARYFNQPPKAEQVENSRDGYVWMIAIYWLQ